MQLFVLYGRLRCIQKELKALTFFRPHVIVLSVPLQLMSETLRWYKWNLMERTSHNFSPRWFSCIFHVCFSSCSPSFFSIYFQIYPSSKILEYASKIWKKKVETFGWNDFKQKVSFCSIKSYPRVLCITF